jgi:PilZ domain
MSAGAISARPLLNQMPFERARMTEQRQHIRYQVEFPATFVGDHTGVGIVYNIGMGGCKVVSDLAVQRDALLAVHLQIPEQTLPIIVRATTVQWTLELEFGVEFLEMQQMERARLEQFLATQVNIAA